MFEYVIELAITTAIGIVSYFLKKTMDKIEKSDQKIQSIEKEYITKNDHDKGIKEVKEEIIKIREDYTPKSDFKEVVNEFRNDLKNAQKDFLTKEDFIREQRKTEDKLDDIYKLLIKQLGGE